MLYAEYNEHLDRVFFIMPDDEVLLEIEECAGNYKDTLSWLKRYFGYEVNSFDKYKFGKVLFTGLETVYNFNLYDIDECSKMIYEWWNLLPEILRNEQPVLCRRASILRRWRMSSCNIWRGI